MRTFTVCLLFTLFFFPLDAPAQDLGSGTTVHRHVGNGSRYTFQDSQGRQWTYAANSQGGYDVFNGHFEKVAYVVATYE